MIMPIQHLSRNAPDKSPNSMQTTSSIININKFVNILLVLLDLTIAQKSGNIFSTLRVQSSFKTHKSMKHGILTKGEWNP